MKNKSDFVFAERQSSIKPFEFNEEVASVFDDMVTRSIPFYQEIHRLCADMVLRFYKGEGKIFDLGCSTGTTIALLEKELQTLNRHGDYIGVDTSAPMLELAAKKCEQVKSVSFVCKDMCEVDFTNSEVVILNYTLQFLSLEKRLNLLKKIYNGLLPGGIIIISEKIYTTSAPMQELITDIYYDFKRRNGYSELEISQKREALENVLIPLNSDDQMNMLKKAGFNDSEMIFRWYNFASFLGRKSNA